ncbi:MAG TPA: 4Fe-4S binding protein [Planctomycetota bacterium]|jgi:MinD superfamily P-loop ATPase|nr:4Fe-4S binding protein [Planctomycetota bacterium]OQC20906.1 MAG: NADH dehydrogenase subunit I [Planctomycetes bacterium ADurb.Bin069]NMD34708.1 4Fe-4S binding protein [Planctomycetota bacterium]HNR98402.1 4Fe-4S binding protein [Planctomycetota bacterium]HNU25178.1 4Fe-4S binding protein [Planctomycetota bacterium]
MTRELVVISGKGGTGKTSLAASFAVLAHRPVIADCDVDAADLHLVLAPRVRERHEFWSGHEAVLHREACIGCGACLAYCRFGAVHSETGTDELAAARDAQAECERCDYCRRSCSSRTSALIREMAASIAGAAAPVYTIDPLACEGCGVCALVCPTNAIEMRARLCGEWMVSDTRCGPMVHARLGVAAENSGKLVSTVRQEARRIAEKENRPLIIADGPPGIGCPVIASLTGASLVLVVTEPTVSGEHDMARVLALAAHFGIPAAVCVNKWDLEPAAAERIEGRARKAGARIAGRVRYDPAVTSAQVREMAIVETDAASAEDVRRLWSNLGA